MVLIYGTVITGSSDIAWMGIERLELLLQLLIPPEISLISNFCTLKGIGGDEVNDTKQQLQVWSNEFG